jgi:hypothetical protein
MVGPGNEQKVQVTIDTTQLAPSTHITRLTFDSNKGSQVVSIKVTVTSQHSTINHVPNWSVDLTNLDPNNSRCSGKNGTWICSVMLTETATSQENINWSPNSNLEAITYPGRVFSNQVTFTNCGRYTGNVNVSTSTNDGANWLFGGIKGYDRTPGSLDLGPLGAGQTDTIFVSANTNGMTPATYRGTISATLTTNGSVQQGQPANKQLTIGNTGEQTLSWNVQNDADNPSVQVTITLVVTPPPRMQLSTATLPFGTCPTKSTSQSKTITNAGGGTLNWKAGTPSVSWLTVALTFGSNSNQAGQSSTLTFAIGNVNSGNATVVITAVDGESATVIVTVNACIT